MVGPNPRNSGNQTHDDAVAASEGSRQSAVKASGASQATVKAAEIAHYRTLIASAKANGQPYQQFVEALMELGTGGV
jgi:ferritin-like metal-binding protein YciE